MESLNDDAAKSMRKMSTVQLRNRLLRNLTLIKATADEVAEMPSDALLECMANLYAVLKEQVDSPLVTIDGDDEPTEEDEYAEAEPAEAVPVTPSSTGAAVQIEALKLQLQLQRERQQYEREMQLKDLEVKRQHEREIQEKESELKRQHEIAMQENQREMQERDLELRRMEAASTEQLKHEELEVKRLEITEQNKREKQEVIQLKRYADAIRGVLHPQPADPCGLPLYFDDLEKLYKQFDVPAKLQASLLIPYLNTSTQMMITRLPAGDLESYTKLKTFIVAQHKLSSKDYKQRFSHAMRNSKETNVAYVSRLSALQDYWLRSKEVTTVEQLRDLHVLEKLHDTLHPMVLRHVRTVEADKNVTAMQAAQIADVFEGNLPSDSKLRHQIEHFEPDSAHQLRVKSLRVENIRKTCLKRAMIKMVQNQKQVKMAVITRLITNQKRKET